MTLEGNLTLPEESRAIVLFAHGSGSSRRSPRNRYVARVLNEAKLATLLIDLLTLHEEVVDARTAQLRFDIGLLAERLIDATDWLTKFPDTKHLRIGYFGASTGAAAALAAAAVRPRCGARDRLARRPSRFGWCGLDARSGSHVVDRRRTRRPGRAAKPASADAAALRKAACDRARSNASVRRTGRAGRSGAVGVRLVPAPS
ncbi:MAG: dienelactone hydrolase family protein [Bradyrhizobium sp.]